MNVYFDVENLLSFIEYKEKINVNDYKQEDLYVSCEKMLHKQVNIVYNCSKQDVLNNPLLRRFYEKGKGWKEGKDLILGHKKLDRPLKSNCYNDFKSKDLFSSVFLLNDEKVEEVKKKGTLLIGGGGEEVSVLSQLLCDESNDYHKLFNIQDKNNFSGWASLATIKENQMKPLSDIVIMDRYIASREDLLEYNLYLLLKTLVSDVCLPVNVIIVSDKVYWDNNTRVNYSPDWKEIRKKIKKIVKGEVTFLFFPKPDLYKRNKHPHDRTIFTNYWLYRSGDSFCYYDSQENIITEGKSLDIDSLAKDETYRFAMSFLDDVGIVWKDIQDKNRDVDEDLVLGSGKCNYLTINPRKLDVH